MNIRTHIRRPRASTVVASLALFVALGGSATAATLVTGATVKNSTLTGKDVKDGSLARADMSKKARAALKGDAGAKGASGATGPQGPQGAQGAQGPRGVVTPVASSIGNKNIDANSNPTQILSIVAPAGKYVVQAKGIMYSPNADLVTCVLFDNEGAVVDRIRWNSPAAGGLRNPVSLSAVMTSEGATVSISCEKDGAGAGSLSEVKLIAIPVG